MIAQQRAQLAVGRDEISRIDGRVIELQERLERKRMMNQQLANQISAATSAKQEQLRVIQQSMMAAGNNGTGTGTTPGKNKNKPVSTVEPFQRQPHGGAVPKGEDLHNNINKNHHGGQGYLDEKDAKYQTLPFSRYNNNGVANKKDLQNVRFSEAPPSTDYQRSYIDHQGNYSNDNNNGNNVAKSGLSASLKPMSSVAPVVMQSQSRDSSPDDLSGSGKSKPALPPKPVNPPLERNGSVSPPPYVPAPPPGLSSDTSPENAESSITVLRGKRYQEGGGVGQHPSEEGTSVDDDMPSEEDEDHSNGGQGKHRSLKLVDHVVHVE
jgi:hypothetical protein